jgi:HSP20 family protein
MPGIKKEDIKINAYDEKVEIKTIDNAQRKYHKIINLPKQADLETARSTYNNGILEVTFDKKKEQKPKGKEIKIE